jgi:hypothetical protein
MVLPFRGVSEVKIKNIFGHFVKHILKRENLRKSAGNKNYSGLAARVIKPIKGILFNNVCSFS